MARPAPPQAAPPPTVLALLGVRRADVHPLDPRGHPWLIDTRDGPAVLRATSSSLGLAHLRWLHRFLERLAATDFPAPRPLPLLGGRSLASVDGTLWETLSYLAGRMAGWDSGVSLASAGALLARFHQASLVVSPARQRPGALPMEVCRPRSERPLVARFQRELVQSGHGARTRCVVHGDCTTANLLVDDAGREVVAMIDFALAHLGPPESDISFGLWVNGRVEQPAIALDAERIRAFVTGYHGVRPLGDWAVGAIPRYLVGRGLQMLLRQERAGVLDPIQVRRLHWLDEHRGWLEEVVASALTSSPTM
jgi:Ser/Thr protein kinase RdoA (MazF antagonist)